MATLISAILCLCVMSGIAFAQGQTIYIPAPSNCPNDPCSPLQRRAWEDQQYQQKVKRDGRFDFTSERWNCTDPQMLKGLIADVDEKIINQTHNSLAETVWGIVNAKEVRRTQDRLTCHGIWFFDETLIPHRRRQVNVTWYWVNGPNGHAEFYWNAD